MSYSDSQVEVLEPVKDSEQWLCLFRQLEPRFQDVFLLPGYARAYEKIYAAKSGLFVLEKDNRLAFQVFLRRPINTLAFAKDKEILYDIISPEYSGPVLSACSPANRSEFFRSFQEEFAGFCTHNAIVAEFGRLNPYYNNDNEVLKAVSARFNRKIVYIDLSEDDQTIASAFSKGNKSSIKKARRQGVVISQDESSTAIEAFYALYVQTMQRNQASGFYYFSLEFFKELFAQLKDNIALFVATHKERTVAASIFVYYGNYIHYYFSGSDQGSLEVCPNNLLLYEAIQWAKHKGFKVFSLGGGYQHSGNDSLFKFKSSFSEKTTGFYVYNRIYNQQAYDMLVGAYCDFNKVNPQDLRQIEYFPLYRK